MEPLDRLRELEQAVADEFAANRRVLSFDEYFADVCERPRIHVRTAARYLMECLEHYGREDVIRPWGTVTRWRLFDCPWEAERDGRVHYRVVGHEDAQHQLSRILTNFVREGRVTRLTLLHGPNGSAKSSFIQCLARGIEAYSRTEAGAIHTFNWVFPASRVAKKRLGFGGEAPVGALESFAHLDGEDIDARIPGDLRDHPLLILPRERRHAVIESLVAAERLPADYDVGEYLLEGDLSPRSRGIADTLLSAYHGDFQRVLQHVQVERFFFSRRYRVGVVTIEPQMHVDATMRQITMDQAYTSLPPALRTLSLFEPAGDLVDANRGVLEYNDLLKKPLDTYKYLLATCEKGTVALPNAILHLDALFLASSNEKHLNAFKEYQDFPSFKGRMDLIKMPYLRDCRVERAIYEEQIASGSLQEQVAPHATYVVALWAVLTRLRRPDPSRYPEALRPVIEKLTPLEKAELYAGEREPEGLDPQQSREIWAALPQLRAEGQEEADYEGSFGASPREMKEIMLNALQDDRYHGLSAMGVFDELRELVKLKTVYEFLKRPADEGYHDHEAFIDQVFERWLDRVDNEVRQSMGLVSAEQYDELFARYILHASKLLKGEKLYNEKTGRADEPDHGLMKRLEGVWKVDDADGFRRDLIGRVGAWRIDHPQLPLDYRRLFPKLFHALEEDYFQKQGGTIRKLSQHVLDVLNEEEFADDRDARESSLSAAERKQALATAALLETEHGYPRPAIREVLGALLSHRY